MRFHARNHRRPIESVDFRIVVDDGGEEFGADEFPGAQGSRIFTNVFGWDEIAEGRGAAGFGGGVIVGDGLFSFVVHDC